MVRFYCFVTKACTRRPGAAASVEHMRANQSDTLAANQAFEHMHVLWLCAARNDSVAGHGTAAGMCYDSDIPCAHTLHCDSQASNTLACKHMLVRMVTIAEELSLLDQELWKMRCKRQLQQPQTSQLHPRLDTRMGSHASLAQCNQSLHLLWCRCEWQIERVRYCLVQARRQCLCWTGGCRLPSQRLRKHAHAVITHICTPVNNTTSPAAFILQTDPTMPGVCALTNGLATHATATPMTYHTRTQCRASISNGHNIILTVCHQLEHK